MSHSYRKPYCACGGHASAKQDKQAAARSARRRQNLWLRILADYDAALEPHRLECANNNVWAWQRDGKQRLMLPEPRDVKAGKPTPAWFTKLQRK